VKQIEWAPQARVDLRHPDRMAAQRVFRAVDREEPEIMRILRVRHRSQAYR